jgi:ABC-type uncharacterized transport system permease subunit
VTDYSASLGLALVGVGAAAAVVGFAGWWRGGWLARLGDFMGLACLALALAAWGARWRAAGHLPIFGTWEGGLSLVTAVLLGAALARWRSGRREIWPPACLIAALLLVHAAGYSREIFALTISERSWVVDLHAIFAWAAFAALAVNAGWALFLTLTKYQDHRLDRALSFSLSLGFALHTAMMASGSLYKFLLFGRAWSFDPIETLGFVAWVAYGTLLHMHLMAGWEGRRLAGWCLALFVILIVSYRGIVYFPAWSSYHILDMDLRIHLMGQEGGGPP